MLQGIAVVLSRSRIGGRRCSAGRLCRHLPAECLLALRMSVLMLASGKVEREHAMPFLGGTEC